MAAEERSLVGYPTQDLIGGLIDQLLIVSEEELALVLHWFINQGADLL